MDVGGGTLVVGGVIGLALALFGLRILRTGHAPAATSRAFRTLREAGLYHLLFGAALVLLVLGTALPGGASALVSAVIAVAVVAVAVTRYRPRRAKPPAAEPAREKPAAEPAREKPSEAEPARERSHEAEAEGEMQ
jgi:hypothetical protein